MGFAIDLQREPEGAFYVAPERLCVTADGEVTDQDDPLAVRLLVGKGGQLPIAEARRYGLIAEPKAEKGAANKARKGTEDKGSA